jgi:hypothetical protein
MSVEPIMQGQHLNNHYFGAEAPWFGPLLKGFRTIVSSPTLEIPSGEYDVTAWVWNNAGQLLYEKVLRTCHARDLITIDVSEHFPGVEEHGGIIGVLLHAKDGISPRLTNDWITRLITPAGRVTAMITTSNPNNINFPERTNRKSFYRMSSQELDITADWKPMSWHANVSANADYRRPIKVELEVHNRKGEKLKGPDFVIPPFGALVVDLEEIFGSALRQHLEKAGGRGGYTVHSTDGGAIGYHFLQRRTALELAMDHTRPTLMYLNNSYGSSSYLTNRAPIAFLLSALRYIKFRLAA